MSTGADADGALDLVFVSYSHDDAQWAQRIQVLLSPLLRNRRLALWIDADLRAGDAWQAEIMTGISRSAVALLLVSGDFLASRFIMDVELPALCARGVRLAPVLVGECLWPHEPRLNGVQWLHDPGRDGALNLTTDRGQRDKRLIEICGALLRALPDTAAPAVEPARVTDPVPAGPVAEIPAGPVRGAVFGAPELPLGYVPRDELADVVAALVAVDSGAVGVTGQVAALGLHGQGGIGKTVLAAAVAHDEGIGHRFPDGVHWVTVGEQPDVLGLQLQLLGRLGAGGPAPRTVDEAAERLRERMAERRVLLVVDDVWSAEAARAFRVAGPQGRVLYTSRAPAVLDAVSARARRVDVLSPAAARAVAGRIIGLPADGLPALADGVFTAVGRVALAVALLAAAVRGGRSWTDVAADLEPDRDVFGDHPYANTFKAMQIAVDGLSAQLAGALLGLAVFGVDEQIPTAAVARLWAYTRGHTAAETGADLRRLATANLLQHTGDSIGFHDLQHDYLLLHAPVVARLHTDLLAAYRTLLPAYSDAQWWQLPVDEPYVWEHLVRHLRRAGEPGVLAATVTDPAYLARRITTGGAHGAEADLAMAAEALPEQPTIGWWRGWLSRHAHLLIGADGVGAVASTMNTWLRTDPDHDGQPVDPGRLAVLLPAVDLEVRWGLAPPSTSLLRVLTGHTRPVEAVAWSPDGTRLATASADGTARVWNPATGDTTTLSSHSGRVDTLAWSPDGTHLASTEFDSNGRVWNATTGDTTAIFAGHTGGMTHALAWSPDGTYLAGADLDGNAHVWNATTGGEPTATLSSHSRVVTALAWSLDGTHLANTDVDGNASVWNSTTGNTVTIVTGHTSLVMALAWSPDGVHVASASDDGTARVWNATTGRTTTTLSGHTSLVTALAWSPAGTHLATTSHDRTARIWNIATSRCIALTGHTRHVIAAAWSPDGRKLATSSSDGTARIWNPRTGDTTATLTGHTKRVSALAWSPDGMRLATASDDGTARVWNPGTDYSATAPTGHTRPVSAMAWSPDDAGLATVNSDSTVQIWDPVLGRTTVTLADHNLPVASVAWSPDGTRLATSGGNTARIWNSRTGYGTATFTGPGRSVGKAAWSPNGTWLAVASDAAVLVWTARDDSWRMRFRRHGPQVLASANYPFTDDPFTDAVRALAWSPDGLLLAVANLHGTATIWNPTTRVQIAFLLGHTGPVNAVAWSRGGTRLATASGDRTARLWNPATGANTTILTGHDDLVQSVVWSPDGTQLATGSTDGTARVWNPGTGRRTATLDHAGPVSAVAWSPGSTHLATVGGDCLIVHNLADRADRQQLRLGPVSMVAWSTAGIAVAGGVGVVVLDLRAHH